MASALARLLAIVVAMIALSSGGASSQSQADLPSIPGTIAYGGLDRTYHVYRPASLSPVAAVPLVVMLHGGYGTGGQAERTYGWDAAADAGRFVVLYPDGVNRSWNAGNCCGQASAKNVDDVGFLTALITQMSRRGNVDAHRVYVTGMSNGALMTYRLACESRIAFAAIGPVAGTFAATCRGVHQTSVLAIHGLDDTSIPYNGGLGLQTHDVTFPSVPSTIAWWREFDGCEAPAATSSGTVTFSRSTCPHGRDVELITVRGAGHQWPGSDVSVGQQLFVKRVTGRTPNPPSTALDATTSLWKFFSAHRSVDEPLSRRPQAPRATSSHPGPLALMHAGYPLFLG